MPIFIFGAFSVILIIYDTHLFISLFIFDLGLFGPPYKRHEKHSAG